MEGEDNTMAITPTGDAAPCAQYDLDVWELKQQGLSFQAIADHLGMSKAAAYRAHERAVSNLPPQGVDAYRAAMYARIATAREAVMDVLNARHITVSNGQIIREDGRPIEDDAPVLAAVDRLLKLDDQEAKLRGAYPKTEVNVTGNVRYEVVGLAGEDLT
jgi:hypothetical protein